MSGGSFRLAWYAHRGRYRVMADASVCAPEEQPVGHPATHRHRSPHGSERSVILAYIEDGPNLVTLATNGWADRKPVWWLNLRAHPGARVDLGDGPCLVKATAAEGVERSRLWARWREIDENLDAFAALRSSETPVVILEPS